MLFLNKKIDLIFYSESHNRANMTFENFLNSLTKISQAIGYNKRGPVEGFHLLIHEYMMPLYDEILKSPNYYTVSILENNIKFDELCNYLIRNVGPVLYEIYAAYFPWEIANSTIYNGCGDRSEKAYKEFLKDFDICPSIITKTMAFQLWNSVTELQSETYSEICELICHKKPKGKHLTFSKFVDLLVKISYLYARESQEIPSEMELPSEILIMLLEKLELSSGFLNLEKKTNKPHTSRTSLLPSKEIMTLVHSAKDGDAEGVVDYIKDKNLKLIQKLEAMKITDEREVVPHNIPQIMNINSMDKGSFYRRNQEVANDTFEPHNQYSQNEVSGISSSLDQFHEDLVNVYEMYCSLGDPMNTHFLNSSKFTKMINTVMELSEDRDQLYLNRADIDLIFAKAVNYENKSKSKRDSINFEQFVFALELIAIKIYGYSSEGTTTLIREYILPLKEYISQEVTNNSEHIIQLMDMLKDDEMVNLLELIHQTLYPYYTFYSTEEGLMTAEYFEEF